MLLCGSAGPKYANSPARQFIVCNFGPDFTFWHIFMPHLHILLHTQTHALHVRGRAFWDHICLRFVRGCYRHQTGGADHPAARTYNGSVLSGTASRPNRWLARLPAILPAILTRQTGFMDGTIYWSQYLVILAENIARLHSGFIST